MLEVRRRGALLGLGRGKPYTRPGIPARQTASGRRAVASKGSLGRLSGNCGNARRCRLGRKQRD